MVNDWNMTLIGDVFEFKNGLNKGKEFFGFGTPIINYTDVYKNRSLNKSDIKGKVSLDTDEIKRFEAKQYDVFFTRTSETPDEVGMSSVLLEDIECCVFSGFVLRARPKNQTLLPRYCKYCFSTPDIRSKIILGCTYTTRALTNGKQLSAISIPVPPISEQERIAETLSDVDDLISSLEKLIEKYKSIKATCLQQMFPQKGETTPKMRLPGFTGVWEKRKVGDFTNVLSASRVHKNEWVADGIPFYRSSDVVSAFRGTDNKKVFIPTELYEELIKSSGKLEKDDILITGGGSIGIPYIVPDNEPLYSKDADLIWVKKSTEHDSEYLYSYFTSHVFREYISSISHVGTIAHYTIEQVKDTPVQFPTITEQRAIGSFFRRLDNLITLHQRKLDKAKKIKQGMMQQLLTGKIRLVKGYYHN